MTILDVVGIWGLWTLLGKAIRLYRHWRHKENESPMLQWVEFIGGSKDGDREAIPHGMTRWTVTRLVPVLAPHWSRAEDDPTDLYRVQVVGWYERQGATMTWRAV